MPAKSKQQRVAMCVAYQAKKRGSPKGLKGTSKQMYDSMSLNQLRDFCKGTIKNSQMRK